MQAVYWRVCRSHVRRRFQRASALYLFDAVGTSERRWLFVEIRRSNDGGDMYRSILGWEYWKYWKVVVKVIVRSRVHARGVGFQVARPVWLKHDLIVARLPQTHGLYIDLYT